MRRQVRAFIERDGEARFTHWDRVNDSHAVRTQSRLGMRKPVKDSQGEVIGWEYFFFIEGFRMEVCDGFDWKAVLRVLRERGDLVPDKGRPFDCKPRLPGLGLTACYCVKSSILDTDSEE